MAAPTPKRGDGEYLRHRRAQRKAFAGRHRRLHLWFLSMPFTFIGIVIVGAFVALALPRAIAFGAYVSSAGAGLVLYVATLAYRGWLRWKEDRVSVDLVLALSLVPFVPYLLAVLLWLNDPLIRDDPSTLPYRVAIAFPWVFLAYVMGFGLTAGYRDYKRYLESREPDAGLKA